MRAEDESFKATTGLQGKRVVVTRAADQASSMMNELKRKGAIPYLFPLIQTTWPNDQTKLDQVIQQLDSYDWLIFTSVNGVQYFFQYCLELYEAGRLKNNAVQFINQRNIQIAAVGPKTKQELESLGLHVHLTPAEAKQEDLAEEICRTIQPKQRVLFPKGQMAREHLKEVLEQQSILVDEVVVYETIAVEHSTEETDSFIQKLERREVDVLTFTSSSTVRHFIQVMEDTRTPWREYISSVVVACIGPITAQTAERMGMKVDIQAQPYTIEALIEELDQYYRRKQVQS